MMKKVQQAEIDVRAIRKVMRERQDNQTEKLAHAINVAEDLMAVVSNVSNGDWTTQSDAWQKAARRAVDAYGDMLGRVAENSDTKKEKQNGGKQR